jgi:Fe2+ transport system protein B
MAEDFFKKIGEDWKKGFEKFKEGVDKTFKIPSKKNTAETPQITDSNQESNQSENKSSRVLIENKPQLMTQWNENWKNFTKSAQNTLTKWQEDWENQAKKIEERNQQNRLAFKAKTEEFNQNVKNFFTKQQADFNNKIQEMETKYKQRDMERKEVIAEMNDEWNAFIEDSKHTFKQLQKSQDRIFWKSTAYWILIISILMAVVFGIMYVLRYLNILPTTTVVTT